MSFIPKPGLLRPSPRALIRASTMDNMMTFDQATMDSTGAFLLQELERLDQTEHDPLVAVSWDRDIFLREDVSMGDEYSAWTNSAFATAAGIGGITQAGGVTTGGGISWASKDANAITSTDVDIGKTSQQLFLWAQEIGWTLPELASAMLLGRPIDQQKYNGLMLKHQMDLDQLVYIGDTTVKSYGLVNSPLVNATNVATGASGFTVWAQKTPDEILADVNTTITSAWASAGWKFAPDRLLVPMTQFGYITTAKVSLAGNVSILKYLRENSICNEINGRPLQIYPVKWLQGRGAGGTDRMVAYTKNKDLVRFPMVPLARTPVEYRSLYQITTYYGRMGQIEYVYPESAQFSDGI